MSVNEIPKSTSFIRGDDSYFEPIWFLFLKGVFVFSKTKKIKKNGEYDLIPSFFFF